MGRVVRHVGVLRERDSAAHRASRFAGSNAAPLPGNRSGAYSLSATRTALTVSAIMSLALSTLAQEQRPLNPTDCGFQPRDVVLKAIADAVAAGEIPDPTRKVLPVVQARTNLAGAAGVGGVPTVMPDDIFFFEDSESRLVEGFSTGQLFNLMADATNAVLTDLGDNFDFIGIFLNFVPFQQIGGAFYLGL